MHEKAGKQGAGRQAGRGPSSPGDGQSRDQRLWPQDLEDAICKGLADGNVTVAWEAGKDLAAAILELTIPAEVARDHVAATLRSLGPRVAAAGLDDERRLRDEEISGALPQAPSLDELASVFERLAYKAVYAALLAKCCNVTPPPIVKSRAGDAATRRASRACSRPQLWRYCENVAI